MALKLSHKAMYMMLVALFVLSQSFMMSSMAQAASDHLSHQVLKHAYMMPDGSLPSFCHATEDGAHNMVMCEGCLCGAVGLDKFASANAILILQGVLHVPVNSRTHSAVSFGHLPARGPPLV